MEEIITLPKAGEKEKEFWAATRHEPLSKTESGIIRMIDTLTNAPVFQKFTRHHGIYRYRLQNIGNYQIGPWFNWVTSNGWEGFRVRFDIATNKHFHKKFKFTPTSPMVLVIKN